MGFSPVCLLSILHLFFPPFHHPRVVFHSGEIFALPDFIKWGKMIYHGTDSGGKGQFRTRKNGIFLEEKGWCGASFPKNLLILCFSNPPFFLFPLRILSLNTFSLSLTFYIFVGDFSGEKNKTGESKE
ncbi:hypothetical protein CEXT_739341 [Caerostris extrusa]|uniref:Uncharacterized protein n=1 Tax=Caerostris extrusa TaxID=172846 RepID=A0AAV4QZR3_CAEEX|nr:hypothetical protein CEXT_739341 [Caerostris extrusa]